MIKASLRIETENPSSLIGTLCPEAGRDVPRGGVEVYREGDDVIVRIEADDLPSLRAALNSYLRWITINEDVIALVGEV